jgi:hypothetical protein
MEVLNRYQRLLPLPSHYVAMPKLAGVLAVHQLLHRGRPGAMRPLPDPGLDAWRWLLRLSTTPSPALELASLFVDVADSRAADEETAGWAHEQRALASVRLACQALEPLALAQSTLFRMSELILRVQIEPSAATDPEVLLLRDARDLAFFSTGSDRALDEQGAGQAFITVTSCLQRMSEKAICLALTTRQPPLIEQIIESTLESRQSL